MLQLASTYEFLLGNWRIERMFTEHLRRERGAFRGSVAVAPVEAGETGTARYLEEGQFHLGAYRGDGQRRLTLVRQESGAATLRFEDGHHFADCDLSSGRCLAIHRCGDDLYEIAWQVLSADALAEQWHVSGPRKHYDAFAVLHRTTVQLQPS